MVVAYWSGARLPDGGDSLWLMTMMSTTALPAREEDSFRIAVDQAKASLADAGRILLCHLNSCPVPYWLAWSLRWSDVGLLATQIILCGRDPWWAVPYSMAGTHDEG